MFSISTADIYVLNVLIADVYTSDKLVAHWKYFIQKTRQVQKKYKLTSDFSKYAVHLRDKIEDVVIKRQPCTNINIGMSLDIYTFYQKRIQTDIEMVSERRI